MRIALPLMLGGILGALIFLSIYGTEFFSWPGPGDFSSITIVVLLVSLPVAAIASAWLSKTKHGSKLPGMVVIFIIGILVSPAAAGIAVVVNSSESLVYGRLEARNFYVEPGLQSDSGSIGTTVKVWSSKETLNLTAVNTLTRSKSELISQSVDSRSIESSSTSYKTDFPYLHTLSFEVAGAYELFETSEPRQKDFTILREEIQTTENCQVGLVYPTFTWAAYNSGAEKNLYTVPIGTWVDSLSPISGNREDYHTHSVSSSLGRVLLEQVDCMTPLSDSDLHETNDWANLDLIVISGHSEFWTSEMLDHVEKFVRDGGNLAIFSGNVAYKDFEISDKGIRFTKLWAEGGLGEETLLGSAFRYGGYSPTRKFDASQAADLGLTEQEFAGSDGMWALQPDHPIFQGTNLRYLESFGVAGKIHYQEMDGVPLEKESFAIDRRAYSGPVSDEGVLAYSYASYDQESITKHGSIVEFNLGRGHVVNLGSLGWGNSVANDKAAKSIALNTISYLLGKNAQVLP